MLKKSEQALTWEAALARDFSSLSINVTLQNQVSTGSGLVLLSNHISNTGGWLTCGKSGAWKVDGELAIAADGTEACIVICAINGGALDASLVTNLAIEDSCPVG